MYRTKAKPTYSIPAAHWATVATLLPAHVVPNTYFWAACAYTRWQIFLHALQQDLTPVPDPITKRLQMDSRAPFLEQLDQYHAAQYRRALVDLLHAGDWVDKPHVTFANTPALAATIAQLNAQFQQHPLGRQSHLPFSSKAKGLKRLFGQPDPIT